MDLIVPSVTVRDTPSVDWDAFVAEASNASLTHLSGWTELAREVFGHRVLFIEARDASETLTGVLPIVQQRHRLLGNFATSVAFFTYGGALAADPEVAQHLMRRGAEAADALGCCYLEFRDTQPRSDQWSRRSDKVALQLDLPGTFEELAKRLGSKLRSQVKRAEREGLERRIGTVDLLDDFYAIFAENMRDLGTPVYPKRFFEAILRRFESHCRLIVIDWQGRPAAAGFLTFWRDRTEIPWASCRAEAKRVGVNMKLYWEVLALAIERGCSVFDFGRSTIDSGTDRFKRQWGAQPVPLYWYRWERAHQGSNVAASEGKGRGRQLATAIWQRLPLQVANTLGPLISGALPW